MVFTQETFSGKFSLRFNNGRRFFQKIGSGKKLKGKGINLPSGFTTIVSKKTGLPLLKRK